MNDVPFAGNLPKLLITLGLQVPDVLREVDHQDWYSVLLDGRVLGRVRGQMAEEFVNKLRLLKVTGRENVSNIC